MKHLAEYTCYKDKRTKEDGMEETVLVLRIPAKLICGGISGAMGQTIAYPLDVIRRRMQLAMMEPETQRFGFES